jgi:hypothetical protein
MHYPNCYWTLKCITSAAIVQSYLLTRGRHTQTLGMIIRVGKLEHFADLCFSRTIKHWGCKRQASPEIVG